MFVCKNESMSLKNVILLHLERFFPTKKGGAMRRRTGRGGGGEEINWRCEKEAERNRSVVANGLPLLLLICHWYFVILPERMVDLSLFLVTFIPGSFPFFMAERRWNDHPVRLLFLSRKKYIGKQSSIFVGEIEDPICNPSISHSPTPTNNRRFIHSL